MGFAPNQIATLVDTADGRIRRAECAVSPARFELTRAKLSDLPRMQ